MNILLINPPIRENAAPYFQPIGLAIIAKMLQNSGYYVEIFDINSKRYKRDEIEYLLTEKSKNIKFDIIGIGGLISVYNYLNFIFPILRKIFCDIPIVLGGGVLTSSPSVVMNNLKPDFGVIGEGEYTFLELVTCIKNKNNFKKVLGIAYFENEKLLINPQRPLEKDLDKFPFQAFDLLDMETYLTNVRHNKSVKREVAILATRGCPFNCSYCYHIFGRGVRYRSVDNVLAEVEYLKNRYNVESFMFNDECFTSKRSYVYKFCEELQKRKLNIKWSTFSRIDTIDKETMKIMNKSGCEWIGFGLESGSEKILKEMNKKTSVDEMREKFLLAKKKFNKVSGTMIFGMPSEDNKTIDETISFCKSIHHYQPFFCLTPYPGTEIYNKYKDKILKEYKNEHEYFLKLNNAKDFIINLTNYNDNEYLEKKYEMEKEIKSFVNSKKSFFKIYYLLKTKGLKYIFKKILYKLNIFK